MFAKKFLSIVGLLFFGSQISKVAADCDWTGATINGEAETCSGITGCGTDEYGYYYKAKSDGNVNNVIVKVDGQTSCKIVTDSGYYITKDNKYYSVDNSNLATVVEGDGTAAQITGSCTTNNVGTLFKDTTDNDIIKICLTESGDSAEFGNGKFYLITEGSGTSGLLTGGTENVIISTIDSDAIKVITPDDSLVVSQFSGNIVNASGGSNTAVTTGNLIVLDSDSKVKNTFNCDNYCLDKITRKLYDRKVEYCADGTECSGYFTCNGGVCEDKSTVYTRRAGCTTNEELITGGAECATREGVYYFIASATGKTESDLSGFLNIDVGARGYLHKCTIAANGDSNCAEETKAAGYFKSQNGGDIAYIQCTPNDTETTTCIGLMDAPQAITSGKTSCGNGEGETLLNGAYVSGSNYQLCSSGSNSGSAIPLGNLIQLTDTCTSFGQLIKDESTYKLCVKSNSGIVATDGVAFTEASYFVDAKVANAFNKDAQEDDLFVVVDIDEKSAIVDRSTNPKKYKYAVASTNEIVNKADGSSKGLCSGNTFQTAGHEFEMTIPNTGNDKVNYYKDNDRV
jgi:hypothetical protein